MSEKPAAANESKPSMPAPAKPDPHASHDMEKSGMPPKGAEKK